MTTLTTQQVQAMVLNLATKKGAQLEQLAGTLLNREFLLTNEEFTVSVSKTDLDKNIYAVLRQWNDWNNNGLEATVIFQALTRATKDDMTDFDKASKELVKLTKAALYLGMGLMEDLTGCEKVKEELKNVKEELKNVKEELDDLTKS